MRPPKQRSLNGGPSSNSMRGALVPCPSEMSHICDKSESAGADLQLPILRRVHQDFSDGEQTKEE
jgi:hypothetical protein